MPAVLVHVPILTDGVVTLRGPDLADVDAMTEQCLDPDMQRWTGVPRDYTRHQAVERIDRVLDGWADPHGSRSWAVTFDKNGHSTFGGSIDLHPSASPRVASMGFGLHPSARGRGMMSRSVRLVAAHAFATTPWGHPVTRLHVSAVVGN